MPTPMPTPTLRTATVVATSIAMLLALLALRALETQWPPFALWTFVLLSLTLGFGHGALDAVLLLGQFAPRSKLLAASALYLLCVLLAGWALSWSVPWALLLLVLMSAWHFGELHSAHLWTRLCVGGAGVMWPALVAQGAMSELLQGALGLGFSTAWLVWQLLAKGWLIGVLICTLGWTLWWLLKRQKPTGKVPVFLACQHHRVLWAALEIAALLCAYLVLSPLLAFALYFGVYHCLAHVLRVRRALRAHSHAVTVRYTVAFVTSAMVTAALLVLLWWLLPAMPWQVGVLGSYASTGQVLQWLVVSLAAVTLPHLILVSYSTRWLGR